MDNRKETDVEAVFQNLIKTTDCAVELKKLMRILTARIKNLQDDISKEPKNIEQTHDCFSERMVETAKHLHEITSLATELQNNIQKLNIELSIQPANIREQKGRRIIHATDSGFDSAVYSATSNVITCDVLCGLQDTNPPENTCQSCSSVFLEACGQNYPITQNNKDSEC